MQQLCFHRSVMPKDIARCRHVLCRPLGASFFSFFQIIFLQDPALRQLDSWSPENVTGRCEQDSNLRGNIPLDFESNALTTRPSQLDKRPKRPSQVTPLLLSRNHDSVHPESDGLAVEQLHVQRGWRKETQSCVWHLSGSPEHCLRHLETNFEAGETTCLHSSGVRALVL